MSIPILPHIFNTDQDENESPLGDKKRQLGCEVKSGD